MASRAVLAVIVATVLSRAIVAIAYEPVNSDITVYERYAFSVAEGMATGRSFTDVRDSLLREQWLRDGRPKPTTTELMVEYPPLAVAGMAGVAVGLEPTDLQPSATVYDTRYRLILFVLDILILVGLAAWLGWTGWLGWTASSSESVSPTLAVRLAVYGAGGLVLANLIYDRLDLIVGALLLASVWLLVSGRWFASFFVLAIAINFKASPMALAPLWVFASLPREAYLRAPSRPGPLALALFRRAFVLAGMAGVIFLPFVVADGSRSFDFVVFRGVQGVQVESAMASALLLLQLVGLPVEVVSRLGAFELSGPLTGLLAFASPLAILVGAIGLCGLLVRSAIRRPAQSEVPTPSPPSAAGLAAQDPTTFLRAVVATLLVTLVASKVLSPQYLLWLLPLVPLLDLGDRTRPFQVLFMATTLVTTAIFPYLYGRTLVRADPAGDGYLDPTLLGVGLVVARNALLIALAWLSIRPFVRHADPGRARATDLS